MDTHTKRTPQSLYTTICKGKAYILHLATTRLIRDGALILNYKVFKLQGMLNLKKIDKETETLKALIEYKILVSDNGDYIMQALTLKDMNPKGWA